MFFKIKSVEVENNSVAHSIELNNQETYYLQNFKYLGPITQIIVRQTG